MQCERFGIYIKHPAANDRRSCKLFRAAPEGSGKTFLRYRIVVKQNNAIGFFFKRGVQSYILRMRNAGIFAQFNEFYFCLFCRRAQGLQRFGRGAIIDNKYRHTFAPNGSKARSESRIWIIRYHNTGSLLHPAEKRLQGTQ